jgi:hypothetical protein
MIFTVDVGGVDGETDVWMKTPSVRVARSFLSRHDHEGSSVGMIITIDNPEEVYRLLDLLGEKSD